MNKIAVVTGGGRGIGLGIVRELVKDCYSVVIIGSSKAERYRETLDDIRQCGGDVFYFQGNIRDVDEIYRNVSLILERFGRIDVLVNNAGVAPPVRTDLLEMTQESFDYVVGTNTRGTMFMTQAVAKAMIMQKPIDGCRGIIINIGSISADVSSTNRGEYCISKAGISILTKLYADRLAASQIFVYEIRPGIIKTDMTAVMQEKYDALFAGGISPIARWGTPEDIGKIAKVLCSGAFRYTTGQVIYADGGLHIQRL